MTRRCIWLFILLALVFLSACREGSEQQDGARGDNPDGDASERTESPPIDGDGDLDLEREAGDRDGEPEIEQEVFDSEIEAESEVEAGLTCADYDGECIESDQVCDKDAFHAAGLGDVCPDERPTCCIPRKGQDCENDSDCPLDNQYCDHPEAGSGLCSLFCDLAGGVCDEDRYCTDHRCTDIPEGHCKSDLHCGLDQYCNFPRPDSLGKCVSYCFVMGEVCPQWSECDDNPDSDTYGYCVQLEELPDDQCKSCLSDDDCEEDEYCHETGRPDYCGDPTCCREKCSPTRPCSGDLICNDYGICVAQEGECDGGCPQGYICDDRYNICRLNCPSCGPNECCDASSAPNCYMCNCTNPPVCGVLLKPCCYGYCCSAVVYGVLGYCM